MIVGFLLVEFPSDKNDHHYPHAILIWLWLTCGWKFTRHSYEYLLLVTAGVMGIIFGKWLWVYVASAIIVGMVVDVGGMHHWTTINSQLLEMRKVR